MTSVKNMPQARRTQWCPHSASSNVYDELNTICEESKSKSAKCRISVERKGSDPAVVLNQSISSIMSDISLLSDSALHCFNPLDVGIRPFEVTPDDIILWNEGDGAEIMDIEKENSLYMKFVTGFHMKDERVIILSDFEKQMILLADANNRRSLEFWKGSDKKPSPEQLDKVYNVLRETVSKVSTFMCLCVGSVVNTSHRNILSCIHMEGTGKIICVFCCVLSGSLNFSLESLCIVFEI
jgi:hypothetical protein